MKIRGRLSKILWRSNGGPGSEYTIALFEAPSMAEEYISIKGKMVNPKVGMNYDLWGTDMVDARYGRVFKFNDYTPVCPNDIRSAQMYLENNVVGVGAKTADRLIRAFGDKTLDVCRRDPAGVNSSDIGVSASAAERLYKTLNEDLSGGLSVRELVDMGVPEGVIDILFSKYGKRTPEILKSNPYVLSAVPRFGFRVADKIALDNGFSHKSIYRIHACVHYIIKKAERLGHTCAPTDMVIEKAQQLLDLDSETLQQGIVKMMGTGSLRSGVDNLNDGGIDNAVFWLARKHLYLKEHSVASDISSRLRCGDECTSLLGLNDETLTEGQNEAVDCVANNAVCVVTGGPGTGKSYLISKIVSACSNMKVALAAPTGKAAARIREVVDAEATTIHRLLGAVASDTWCGYTFKKNARHQLDYDIIIIDEAGMLDIQLMYSLLSATRSDTRLIFLGDVDQLPPVGSGNVLGDMISAGVPCVKLNEVVRQRPGAITGFCSDVRAGRAPRFNNTPSSDIWLHEALAVSDIQAAIVAKMKTGKLSPHHVVEDPIRDCQVLTPLRRSGGLSCRVLNHLIRSAINSDNAVEGERLWVGDKVIQNRNDYGLGVANGDIGYVTGYSGDGGMVVEFRNPKREVVVSRKSNDLELAYAITVHKYQGSESKSIILPAHDVLRSPVYHRSTVYTAVSRAKEYCVITGNEQSLRGALSTHNPDGRYTRLKTLLKTGT